MSASGPSGPQDFDVTPFSSSAHSKCLVRSTIHILLGIDLDIHIYTCRVRTTLNASL